VTERDWLSYLSELGQVVTPVLVLLLTAFGWRFRQKLERRIELENKLREERVDAYNQILEPFIIMLMSNAAWTHGNQNKGKDRFALATSKLLSLEYRKTAFKLSLIGSDAVVRAYNDLMQHFYNLDENSANSAQHAQQMMILLGTFLLQIRRSMGNEETRLRDLEMLEWLLTDARQQKSSTTPKF
jgi:hypothetical protein